MRRAMQMDREAFLRPVQQRRLHLGRNVLCGSALADQRDASIVLYVQAVRSDSARTRRWRKRHRPVSLDVTKRVHRRYPITDVLVVQPLVLEVRPGHVRQRSLKATAAQVLEIRQ